MDKRNLREELRYSLNEFYHSKTTSWFIEFFQGEGAVLICLQHSEGPIYPSTISEKVGLSRARVTNIINSLRQKGLVNLEQDETDRRKSIVTLTEKGEKLVIEGACALELYMDSLFNAIGEEKMTILVEIVNTVNDTFRRWEREALDKDV